MSDEASLALLILLIGVAIAAWLLSRLDARPVRYTLRHARLTQTCHVGPDSPGHPGLVRLTMTAGDLTVYDFELDEDAFFEWAQGVERHADHVHACLMQGSRR